MNAESPEQAMVMCAFALGSFELGMSGDAMMNLHFELPIGDHAEGWELAVTSQREREDDLVELVNASPKRGLDFELTVTETGVPVVYIARGI